MSTSTLVGPQHDSGVTRTARHWRVLPPTGALALTRRECLQRLATKEEGRLHHMTGVGPRALVVRYARCQNGLWIAVPDRAAAGHRFQEEMALEVNGLPGGRLWMVVVAGEVQHVPAAECPHAALRGLSRHQAIQHLFLPATVVFGFSC